MLGNGINKDMDSLYSSSHTGSEWARQQRQVLGVSHDYEKRYNLDKLA